MWRLAAFTFALGCGRLGFGSDSDALSIDGVQPDPNLRRTWVTRTLAMAPSRRHSPALAYHETRGTIVMYGGHPGTVSSPSQISSELWEYDGTTWTLLCNGCPPGPRHRHALVYDRARDRVVLFGGATALGEFDAELWELDGTQWRLVTPNGTPPSPRNGMHVAYDERRSRVVIFGGLDANGDRDDIFEYDGTSWIGLGTLSGPGARSTSGTSATYDRTRQAVVLYGGRMGTAYADDAWAWDGTSWRSVCGACTGTTRGSAAIAADPASGRIVITGGYRGGTMDLAGTWQLAADNTWALTDPDDPGLRDSAAMAYDAKRNVLVQFGGNGDSCMPAPNHCGDTLEFVVAP